MSKHIFAWGIFIIWLSYSMGALWAFEKDNVRVGQTCSVQPN